MNILLPVGLSSHSLTAGIPEPEQTTVATQLPGKHFPAAKNTQTVIEEFFRAAIYAVVVVSNIQYAVKRKQKISASQNFVDNFIQFFSLTMPNSPKYFVASLAKVRYNFKHDMCSVPVYFM